MFRCASILLYGAALYHLVLGWPGLPYPAHIELFPVGWSNLAAQVEGLEEKLERDSKVKPVIVGMDRYQIVSELTYYDPDQKDAVAEAAGSHLFGQRSLMFERWCSPQSVAGKMRCWSGWSVRS